MGDGVNGCEVKTVGEDAMSSSVSIISNPCYKIMRKTGGEIRYAAAECKGILLMAQVSQLKVANEEVCSS